MKFVLFIFLFLVVSITVYSSDGHKTNLNFYSHQPFESILPKPKGPYLTGTRIFHFIDKSRKDTLLHSNRNIIIQAWYPCNNGPYSKMDYVPEKKLVDYFIQTKYYGIDSNILQSFYTLKTNSLKNASVKKGKFPLLFFSPGLGVAKSNYTTIYEELASQGIIVISIDHLYEGTTILPDNKIVDVNMYPDTLMAPLYNDCVKDIVFIISQLKNKSTEIGKFLNEKINFNRVGATGHSAGGNIALIAGSVDNQIKFCINLDGGDFSGMEDRKLKTPSLILRENPDYSDEELRKKGRDPVKWKADSLKGLQPYFTVLRQSSKTGYLVKIHQTGHMSFSDAPFLMPQMLTMFLGKYLNPEINLEIITGLIVSFTKAFDDEAKLKKWESDWSSNNNLRIYSFMH